MKILKVIHGYPPYYNAGSEVYSRTLCHELSRQGHEVLVFTRQENGYKQEYSVEWKIDPMCSQIKLCLINMAQSRDGYRHSAVDLAFGKLIDNYCPDIIHIGHLSHLSTSLICEADKRNIPILFTLHDYWLMCPRGQFLQVVNSKTANLYPVCDSQENAKCARNCYWRYFSSQEDEGDKIYWTHWVDKRMRHVKEMAALVDQFIAPSRYLMDRFIRDFPLDPAKITYLDYGFHRARLKGRLRKKEENFVFGYIGTHKQSKGIFHLLQAFKDLGNQAKLKIWGSPLEPFTQSLKSYIQTFPSAIQASIAWMGGYRNESIVNDVFNHVDAIVVPSIWAENSPLVIHEALEAGVPVITADYGGMKEYIQHEVNGLLFTHRDPASLTIQMKRLLKDPGEFGKRGYLQAQDGHIPDIEDHTSQIVDIYHQLIKKRKYAETGPLAHHV